MKNGGALFVTLQIYAIHLTFSSLFIFYLFYYLFGRPEGGRDMLCLSSPLVREDVGTYR
jgi:hypothetical protein